MTQILSERTDVTSPHAATVMLVDDHKMVRTGLAALFETASDLRVISQASDGADALVQARTYRPDVVVMDLYMPGMDGVEATKRMLAELPGTRVVVLTACSDEQRLADAMAAGAVGYVSKSLDPRVVLYAVRAAALDGQY
jgi:DNA-binding NarL/FixJ family response regulator